MKYIADTLKYLLKNIWCIVLLGIVPAAFYVPAFDYRHYETFITRFFRGKLTECSFLDLFRTFSLFNVSTWYGALFSAIGFFVVAAFMAIMLALIEKHMRIGKRTLNGIFSKINDNIVATVSVCFVLGAIYEIWAALTALIGTGFLALFRNVPAAAYIFCILAFCLTVYLLLFLMSRFWLWLPCQLITGFQMFESLTYSAHLLEAKKRNLMLAIFLPFFLGNAILALCSLGGTFALAPVVWVVYLFYFLYVGVLMEVVYFDEAEMEREDLKPAYRRGRGI